MRKAFGPLVGIVGVMFVAAPFLIARAPYESTMGLVQKIFYFHVPAGMTMFLTAFVSGIGSAAFLFTRKPWADRMAVAGAELSAVLGIIVLVTGPLWARKAWGVWWTWDPRLTSTLLEAMVFFAYMVLRSFGSLGEVEKRFAAGLAIVGVLDIPVIKYSVQRWRGTHPTVITGKGGGIHPDMGPALYLSLVLFVLLAVVLIWVRALPVRQRSRRAPAAAGAWRPRDS